MKQNMRYVLDNAQGRENLVDWIMCMAHFFGEEKTDEFCDYYIHAHDIISQEDIRNLLPRYSLSVYWAMGKEQMAFVSSYRVIDRKSNLVKNRENGLERVQRFYRKKDIELAKQIAKLGYSYEAIEANWKDKNQKDTFQRDYVFCIFSETDTKEEFQQNIFKLVQSFHQGKVLITDTVQDKGPKVQISSKLYEASSGKVLESYGNTTISILEKQLGEITDTKIVFQIPYEKNKTIMKLEEPKIGCHYAWQKQEKVESATVHSFNMAMLKQSLLHRFHRRKEEDNT